jgi:hypothetical protein
MFKSEFDFGFDFNSRNFYSAYEFDCGNLITFSTVQNGVLNSTGNLDYITISTSIPLIAPMHCDIGSGIWDAPLLCHWIHSGMDCFNLFFIFVLVILKNAFEYQTF